VTDWCRLPSTRPAALAGALASSGFQVTIVLGRSGGGVAIMNRRLDMPRSEGSRSTRRAASRRAWRRAASDQRESKSLDYETRALNVESSTTSMLP
jgi:hypothetical protein